MRKNSFAKAVKTVLVIVPLLGSDGGVDSVILTLPDCQDGQLVGIKPDKTLFCVSVPTATLPGPDCDAATETLTSVKDGVTGKNVVSCVRKGTGLNDYVLATRINNAAVNVNNLQTTLNVINAGNGTRPRFVGASSAVSSGSISAGSPKGIRAANKMCEADFGTGAHMCTPFEIYESLIVGDKLTGNVNVGPLMVYMESWQPGGVVAGGEPTAGMAENCGAHTYPTSDRDWYNTFFTFAVPTGGTVRVAKFDTRVLCNNTASLACCR